MKLITSIIAAVLSLTACTAQTSKSSKSEGKKVLVAYFSATGTTKAQALEWREQEERKRRQAEESRHAISYEEWVKLGHGMPENGTLGDG